MEAIIGFEVSLILSKRGQSVNEQLAIFIISKLCSSMSSTDFSSKGVHIDMKPDLTLSSFIFLNSSLLNLVSENRLTYFISYLPL